MGKVYLVLDEQKSCRGCPLFSGTYTDMVCRGNGWTIDYPYPKDFRQDWCPLKPVPEKKSHKNTHAYSSMGEFFLDLGWNSCVDSILKGSEID